MSSEKQIQNALHRWRSENGHPFIAPNVTMPSGEMDLISVSKSGFVYEHEIKISRADFRADFKHKEEKHVWLQNAKKLKGCCARHIEIEDKYDYKEKRTRLCANYFFYIVPENLILVEEIPVYAGLCHWIPPFKGGWYKHGEIRIIKNAPRLHSEKISKERMEKLAISMMYRYWNYRLKENVGIATEAE